MKENHQYLISGKWVAYSLQYFNSGELKGLWEVCVSNKGGNPPAVGYAGSKKDAMALAHMTIGSLHCDPSLLHKEVYAQVAPKLATLKKRR